jgi:hypothetical protein
MGEGWNAWLGEKGRILGSEGLINRGQFECPNSPRRGVASGLFVILPIVDKGRE